MAGILERAEIARAERLVPIGLVGGAELIEEIPEGGLVTYDNVRLRDTFIAQLRRQQDEAQADAPQVARSNRPVARVS